jgi:mRNA-degrading endonuclease RelE of RelBE toxin-antitoxin system
VEWIWEVILMQVNIKQELSKLDRNDFNQVRDLIDKITEDINDSYTHGNEYMLDVVRDYMFDLLNPNLLDFNNENF